MTRAIRLAAMAALSIVVLGAGCKKAEAPPPAAQEPAPPPPPPVSVTGIDLGRAIGPDKRVTAPTTEFGVRDTIYASVSTNGVSTGSTLTAKWTFGDGQLVDSIAAPIAPTGPAVTEFHVMRTSAWPVGKYKVAILLDGEQKTEREFEIKRR
jgi:hypothetical protein